MISLLKADQTLKPVTAEQSRCSGNMYWRVTSPHSRFCLQHFDLNQYLLMFITCGGLVLEEVEFVSV